MFSSLISKRQIWRDHLPQIQAKLIHVGIFFPVLTSFSKLLGHKSGRGTTGALSGVRAGAQLRRHPRQTKLAGGADGVAAAANVVALPATAFGLITLPTRWSFGNPHFLSDLGIPGVSKSPTR